MAGSLMAVVAGSLVVSSVVADDKSDAPWTNYAMSHRQLSGGRRGNGGGGKWREIRSSVLVVRTMGFCYFFLSILAA